MTDPSVIEQERQHRGRAIQMAHESIPGRPAKEVVSHADIYARYILTGEGAPDPINGPITRAEINRRGFDEEEGSQKTLLGVYHKLGWPSAEHPMGTEPTHRLVPIEKGEAE